MSAHTEKATAWIYSGVWAVLVAWFRVPKEPPALPSLDGEEVRSFKPDIGLVRYQKFFFWMVLMLIDGALTIAWIAICIASPVWGAITFIPYLVIAFVPDVLAYVAIHLRYDTTWYVFSERSLRIRRGIWIIHETTITFENIQNVDVRQGPAQRHFGISTLQVRTAGGGGGGEAGHGAASGPHVGLLEGIADAESLRTMIMQRAAASRAAGLGDERRASEHSQAPRSGPAWSPAHLALLREIRDTARAIRV